MLPCAAAPSLMARNDRRVARRIVVGLVILAALVGSATPARAMSFTLTFDPSTASAPAGFFTALNSVLNFFSTTYTDPITINMHVGWGDINGAPLAPGNLGQSLTSQQGNFTYAQVRTALLNDAKTADDAAATSLSSLPAADPTGGRAFVMSNAEAKALGFLAGNAPGNDGFIGFNSAASWTFDPNNRAVPGAFDFIGIASHEVTEIMGRYGFGQNGGGSRDSPIDLYRFLSGGVHDFTPARGAANANYFSIDGGLTAINSYNVASTGDLSDWAGATADSFNAFSNSGVRNNVSAGDLTQMDVLGYDRSANAVPEPATMTLVWVGLGLLQLARRRQINRREAPIA